MNQLYLQKNLPDSWQFLIRPMLLISLGLHGLLLVMPIPAEKKAEIPKKEEKVKITQLPPPLTSPAPKSVLPPSLKPSPIASQPVVRPTVPVIRQQPVPPLVRQPLQQPKPKSTSTPQEQKKPTPQPSPSPSSSPSQQQADPFANFPRYPNDLPGSGGVLKPDYDKVSFNTSDALDKVASFFDKQLPNKGFSPPTLNSDPKQTDFRVYQTSPKVGGSPQYLHLISQSGKTVILRLPEPYSFEQLKNSQTEERTKEDGEFDDVLAEIDKEVSFTSDLPTPDENNKLSVASSKLTLRYATSNQFKISREELYAKIEERMRKDGFNLQKMNDYGTTDVYKITKGSFTIYLILADANNKTKTVIYTSKEAP